MSLRNTAMKISESRQNTRQHKDKKRLTSSFFLTCFIYLPAFVFAWSSVPETTFKAAGQEQTVALSFAQISGGAYRHRKLRLPNRFRNLNRKYEQNRSLRKSSSLNPNPSLR